jgi:hypothetical protein
MMTTFKSVKDVKSVHIEGKWPYQYVKADAVKPEREVKNAKERERYWKKKAASVKTLNGNKLLKLPVFEMDVFQRLNYESKSRF